MVEMKQETAKAKITRLNELVEALCGVYSRVARNFGVHRTFVSRVARGERRSEPIENALVGEYERIRDR
jgi:DNA invertase Pin-like site-specific DNA recombinase